MPRSCVSGGVRIGLASTPGHLTGELGGVYIVSRVAFTHLMEISCLNFDVLSVLHLLFESRRNAVSAS